MENMPRDFSESPRLASLPQQGCCWGEILHNPSSQVERPGFLPENGGKGSRRARNMHAHTHAHKYTHTCVHAHTCTHRIWLPSTYKCRKMSCIGLFSPQDLVSASWLRSRVLCGLLDGSAVKNPPAVQETRGLIPGWGRAPVEGNRSPLQCCS